MNYVLSFLPALFTDEVNNGSSSPGSSSSAATEDERPVEATLYYFGGRGRADQIRSAHHHLVNSLLIASCPLIDDNSILLFMQMDASGQRRQIQTSHREYPGKVFSTSGPRKKTRI